MRQTRVKKRRRFDEEEYNLSEDMEAKLKRFVSELTGRKVTGELTVHLAEGGINSVKLFEVVAPSATE